MSEAHDILVELLKDEELKEHLQNNDRPLLLRALKAVGREVGGELVRCTKCRLTKAPIGRSVPPEMSNGMCGWDCDGYNQPPYPGQLWPGEEKP